VRYLNRWPDCISERITIPTCGIQTEINPIRYLQLSTGYCNASPLLVEHNLPPNTTLSSIADGLIAAHSAYKESISTHRQISILFVIQPSERNVFDQRSLEYELLEKHSIRVQRRTFDQLRHEALLDPSSSALLLQTTEGSKVEISTVYYRAGYTPRDYTISAHYDVRRLLERSVAINCPSIALQLAGSKKIQAVLAKPGVAESFLLPDSSKGYKEPFTEEDIRDLRANWMDMWGLEEPGGVTWARERYQELVLKPQREGGGNNIYKGSIPGFLDRLEENEREAWIAMELIKVPKGMENYLVRSGSQVVKCPTVSELGTFGWALFGKGKENRYGNGGYLLRTKGEDSDEGGVAAGFSVLDSVVLVD
jgi:glutathione synthetase